MTSSSPKSGERRSTINEPALRSPRRLSTWCGILLLTCLPGIAAPPDDLKPRLESFAKGQPGGAALAWVDADGVTLCATGSFSAKDSRVIDSDTVFEVGSISKVFTAILLAESELRGKVSREDPAARYLLAPEDGLQALLSRLTLRSLSTHTSGLSRLPSNMGPRPDENPDPYAHYDRAKLIEAFRLHGAASTPGRYMAYSNFGVSVLGEVLASAWRMSYEEALRGHVLLPLGLENTQVGIAGHKPPERLAPVHAGVRVVQAWTWQACAAAGGVRSTARDMALFIGAVLGTRETSLRAAIDATLQPQRRAETAERPMGLGWMLRQYEGGTVAWHNGATRGSRAYVGVDLHSRRGVAILVNSSKSPDRLGFSLLGRTFVQPTRKPVEDAVTYTGRYELSRSFAIEITEHRGLLESQATGQSRVPLRELARDRFVLEGVPAEITFERDAGGRIQRLVLHQYGRRTAGKRVLR